LGSLQALIKLFTAMISAFFSINLRKIARSSSEKNLLNLGLRATQ
jgi:hypothetical protein